jgi:TRAP-type C4-dicarboxylate transport system substrate-binding protein
MRSVYRSRLGRATAFGALVLLFAATPGPASAQDKSYVMKVTLPTLNDATHQLAKNFAAAVERDSAGRIKPEIYPASQLGSMPRQIEGVQFGAIQCSVIPPEFFVGVDERFEVLTAPGLVSTLEQGQRLAADPAVLKLMLGLGGNKGLHGVGLFMAIPSSVISRTPIRHLDDFEGKKIRIFASQFQSVALQRLGAAPVAMSLSDVMPALQQGAIDGAVAALAVYTPMHFQDAAKYVTETGQPSIFVTIEISSRWYKTLPADLQRIIDRDGAAVSVVTNPVAIELVEKFRKGWVSGGGELISLPPNEQSTMLTSLASVGDEVSKDKPELSAAYQVVKDAAKRARQGASQ